jgi:hypothetical protein
MQERSSRWRAGLRENSSTKARITLWEATGWHSLGDHGRETTRWNSDYQPQGLQAQSCPVNVVESISVEEVSGGEGARRADRVGLFGPHGAVSRCKQRGELSAIRTTPRAFN